MVPSSRARDRSPAFAGLRRSKTELSLGLVAALASALLFSGTTAISAAAPAAARASNLVANPGFESGKKNWRITANRSGRLTAVSGSRSGARAAKVTTKRRATTVLNARNTVSRTSKGRVYVASAYVRSRTPGLTVHLRERERRAGKFVRVAKKRLRLSGTGWHRIEVRLVARTRGAKIDVNVFARDLRRFQSFIVDDVRLTARPARPPQWPQPPQPPKPPTAPSAFTAHGIPTDGGVLLGAAVGGNAAPEPREAQVGARFGLHRTYWKGSNVSSAVATARADLAARRVPWLSFKLPYSWADMASGRGDAWTRDVATRLGALNGPVWVALHHEPEGDGPIADWVAMQRRLSPVFREQPNIAFTVITTGWNTFFANEPSYRLDALLPDPSIVDVVGIDAYNEYGVTKHGKRSTKMTEMRTYYAKLAPWARAHRVDWALAETGYTDRAMVHDAAWLTRAFADMKAYGGVGLAYFDSALNPIADSTWPLDPHAKIDAFKTALEDSAHW